MQALAGTTAPVNSITRKAASQGGSALAQALAGTTAAVNSITRKAASQGGSALVQALAGTTAAVNSDYASLVFVNRQHVSTCFVHGNISTHTAFTGLYPAARIGPKSLARESGLQET